MVLVTGVFLLLGALTSSLGMSGKAIVLFAVIPVLWVLAIGRITIDWLNNIKKPRAGAHRQTPHSDISEAEYQRRLMDVTFVVLSDIEKLHRNGHLTGRADPNRDFKGRPCWLRYEEDGFYVDYPDRRASWRIDPVPMDVVAGTCDGNGSVSLRTADDDLWAYDALRRTKLFEIAGKPPNPPFFGEDAPYSEIDVRKKPHVDWVKSRRDPALWHLAVQAALAYTGDSRRLVPWLLEQPELDRGTAAWIYLWSGGPEHLETREGRVPLVDSGGYPLEPVLAALHERSEGLGFAANNIGLEQEFEEIRKSCQSLIDARHVPEDALVPYALLKDPLKIRGPEASLDLHLIDGVIVA